MVPISGRQDPGGPHAGPMNLTICDTFALTHWIRGKFATILLMNFSIGFENALFWFEFRRIVLLRVQLVISKRCFMLWLGAEKEKVITLANDFPTKWRIYASPRLKDSTGNTCISVSALINRYHNLTLYFSGIQLKYRNLSYMQIEWM